MKLRFGLIGKGEKNVNIRLNISLAFENCINESARWCLRMHTITGRVQIPRRNRALCSLSHSFLMPPRPASLSLLRLGWAGLVWAELIERRGKAGELLLCKFLQQFLSPFRVTCRFKVYKSGSA